MYVTIHDLKQYMSLCVVHNQWRVFGILGYILDITKKGEGKENVNIFTMWEEKTLLTTFIEGDNKVRVP